jgi:hypothetical protein
MFGMAIGEREIAALGVPVGRNIPPNSGITPELHARHSEGAIKNLILEDVNENPGFDWIRIFNGGKLFKTWVGPTIGIQFRGSVNTEAHIVAAPAELGKLDPGQGLDGGAVGRTMVNAQRTIVREEQTILDAGRINVINIIRAPGGSRYGRAASLEGDRVVRGQKIFVIYGIKVPTGRQLFYVIQTRNGQGFFFGPAERRQEESCENCDDSDYYQQFDQSERGDAATGGSGICPEKISPGDLGQIDVQVHSIKGSL